MKIRMRGKLVGVETQKKVSKSQGVFAMPEDSNTVGVIRYLGDALDGLDLQVGMKVYYGDKRQPVTIDGASILVMESDNIVAVVEEADEQQKTA